MGEMNGILCVDKPEGFTSFDVVAKTRGITGCRKIGHGGTLDPMATGVLPLFLGRATKAMDIMYTQDKRYTASFRLGTATDTQDSTGRVLSQSAAAVSREALLEALEPLRGEIDQLPPMYSAVRVGGKRLYDLARQGKVVERQSRRVTIRRLELLDYDPATREGRLDIACSKGTYVRTLLHDAGASLGCGGVMTALRRTGALGYTLENCHTLEELQELAGTGRLAELLLPVESAFAGCPRVWLDGRQAKMFQNGVRLDTNRLQADTGRLSELDAAASPGGLGRLAVWREEQFLGTASLNRETGELVMEKLFCII